MKNPTYLLGWTLILRALTTSQSVAQATYEPYAFTTFAGNAGSAARFGNPTGVAVDSAGNVYVADQYNQIIWKVTPAGVVTTLAGAGGSGSTDGTGSAARFHYPASVAVDSTGTVYVADTGNNTIRKVTPAGVVTTLAGLADPFHSGSADGTGVAARFYGPLGVAVDSAGNVYVADYDNHSIRKVTPAGVVATVAGLAGNSGSTDGTGSAARFHYPSGVAVDSAGYVYVADSGNNTIRKVTPAGVVTTLAGLAQFNANGYAVIGSADGTGSAARFSGPSGVAVDSTGNVYVADTNNRTIRKVTPSGVVATVAGLAGNSGSVDGTGNAARFNYPFGVAVDNAGNVYVGDSFFGGTIRKGVPFTGSASASISLINLTSTFRQETKSPQIGFDLGGTGGFYSISVLISSDGGLTYGLPATHFSGNGVGASVTAANGKQIIWDAAQDFPNQFSTQMRVKLTVSSGTAKLERESNIFTVDTRDKGTGTVIGRVTNGSTGVANAQVKLDRTSLVTSSGSDGTFTLSNVPVGSGYQLIASAKGYATKPRSSVTVNVGQNNVGTITLSAISESYQVLPLQPDVNVNPNFNPPGASGIEAGGVAYRYYRVVTEDGKTAAPGVTLTVRLAGGADVPQAGDINDEALGREAGVSDSEGMVRLRIPSTAIGDLNVNQTFEVAESGIVRQTFQARVIRRWHEQVWKRKIGGGASGKIAVSKLAGEGAFETELRDKSEGGVIDERLKVHAEEQGKAGKEISAPGFEFGVVKVGAKIEGGAYLGLDFSTTYQVPDTTDQGNNLMKVYISLLGPLLSSEEQIRGALDKLFVSVFGQDLLDTYLILQSGTIHMGGYASGGVVAEAQIALPKMGNLDARVGGEFDDNLGAFIGFEQNPKFSEKATEFGLELEINGRGNWLPTLQGIGQRGPQAVNFNVSVGTSFEMSGKVWTKTGGNSPYRVELALRNEGETGTTFSSVKGTGLDELVKLGLRAEFTETLNLTLPDDQAYSRLQAAGVVWDVLKSDLSSSGTLKPGFGSQLLGGVLRSDLIVSYERSAYLGTGFELPGKFEVDPAIAAVGLDIQFKLESGAESVRERGVIFRNHRMPTQTYSDSIQSSIPSDTLLQREAQWVQYADPAIAKIVSRVRAIVAATGDTIVSAVDSAGKTALKIEQGVINAGSEIILRVVPQISLVGLQSQASQTGSRIELLGLSAASANSSSYRYGISGLYRFESTNILHGNATLSIAYGDADAAGLIESDLRIYRFNQDSNHWYLVGGTVDTVSNIVTTTVTNLGMFAIAPPMPSGDLQIDLSRNTLRTDGVSQMTAVVTNLLLNTGNPATQQWLYTVSAIGVEVLDSDADTNRPGLQIASTNATIIVNLKAPVGGSDAQIKITSVAGDAFGGASIVLLDNVPPGAPENLQVVPGESRLFLSWNSNPDGDVSGYRIYYRLGQAGPPYDGTATVEGTPSPFLVSGTNATIRGLTFGGNYYLALSAVDTTGNESPLTTVGPFATVQTAPAPPLTPTLNIQTNGQYIATWGLSEDDGFNDRDVVQYEIWRAVMPGGTFAKVAQADAGTAIYGENGSPPTGKYWQYGVKSVDGSGFASELILANHYLPSGGIDNDNDGLTDGVIQTQTIQFSKLQVQNNAVTLEWNAQTGAMYRVQYKNSLSDPQWISLSEVTGNGDTAEYTDSVERTTSVRFYRIQLP